MILNLSFMIFISKITLVLRNKKLPIKFRKRQFSLNISFHMIINIITPGFICQSLYLYIKKLKTKKYLNNCKNYCKCLLNAVYDIKTFLIYHI